MRNIQLTLAYDGTQFHGWQRQPGFRTVQQVLEDAIEQLTGAASSASASSRTDAGVHALGQSVNFLTASLHSCETFVRALNAMLPFDLRVLGARETPRSLSCHLGRSLQTLSLPHRQWPDRLPIRASL